MCGVAPFPGDISRFANKAVAFRFKGQALTFRLSHALFSSFDIDAGSRLLLKSIAGQVDFAVLRSALDIGCGVGVIGACVASQAPEARVMMQDRDALAAAFARENCRENGLEQVSVSCSLAFRGLGEEAFDLVTSNLPAKAGKPVLRMLLHRAAGCLTPRGVAAVVIVLPLAAFARESLAAIGCEIVHHEESNGYAVLHYRAGAAARETVSQREDISPYIRSASRFDAEGFAYSLQTAHSLPDFDVIGYAVELALGLARETSVSGRLLAWNPGQGHVPVALLSRDAQRISSIDIASRDLLQCTIAALNVSSMGKTPHSIQALCSEADLGSAFPDGSFDMVIAEPNPIPRVPWQPGLARVSAGLLKPGGALLVVCTSTEIRRFLDQDHGFQLAGSGKHAGFRR